MCVRAVLLMRKAVIAKVLLGFLFFSSGDIYAKLRQDCSTKIGDWYEVTELRKNLFMVQEPDHVTFFILKFRNKAIFIDSGLGLNPKISQALLDHLKLTKFIVLCTHLHSDHVGMNGMAREVWTTQAEWDKHVQQGEYDHMMRDYYEVLKDESRWPPKMTKPPAQAVWKPTNFIVSTSRFNLGRWRLRPIALPGHTVGHVGFYEETTNAIFTGDHVYDGHLYLNLKDSSLRVFLDSLKFLSTLLHPKEGEKPLLLPAHNTIPLKTDYVDRTADFVNDIIAGRVKPTDDYPGNPLLLKGYLFKRGDVKVLVRGDDEALVPRKN